ncbi:hypothetical protein KY342_01310 [Candidatus Woesearchaeota archaeon]|nr:hypothetical protein [Candidatus Woesearchaeota archaeon]
MEELNQAFDWVNALIYGGIISSIAGVISYAVYAIRKDCKEYELNNQQRERNRHKLEAVLDCGEVNEKEALIARLYIREWFGCEDPKKLYQDIGKGLGVDEDRVEEMRRLVLEYVAKKE